MPFRSAQADRRPKALQGRIHSAHKPTAGRRLCADWNRPSEALARQASAFADAESIFRSAQADRWPKALKVEFIRRI